MNDVKREANTHHEEMAQQGCKDEVRNRRDDVRQPESWRRILHFIGLQPRPGDGGDGASSGSGLKAGMSGLRARRAIRSPYRPDSRKNRYRAALEKAWYFFMRQTSPIHRQDAKEKYWILWRELEAAMHAKAIELEFTSYVGFKRKHEEEVEAVFERFLQHLNNRSGDLDKARTFSNLLLYARILAKQPLDMLYKAEALNMMWRDITFVRSRLLADADIMPNERLTAQLEYCRLECSKVCGTRESGLEEMCHDAALELMSSHQPTHSNGDANSDSNQKARRTLVTILAKLNHIRLNDINAQLRIKKIYNIAFVLLLLLSVVLLHLNERLTDQFVPYWVAYNQFLATFEWTAPNTWVSAPMDFAIFMIQNNLLFYIFFAGLLGGIFSTVMKLRSRDVNIGDVYLRSYLLTKPIVGALGATILYIIIKSNIVGLNLGQIQVIDQISKNSYMFGPLGFSFGFIMGFSERIILPTVDTESKS